MAGMCELARLSDLAANVLRQHADAPAVCAVKCAPGSVISRASVSLQVASVGDVGEVRAVAGWALEWGAAVLFTAVVSSPGQVRVATRIEAATADGPVDVEVWTYVAESSLVPLGLDLPADVEVPANPDVVLSRLDDATGDDSGVV